jgi:hypothetical protein
MCEQAGLAVAVLADDADPVAVVQAERDGVEDDLCGKLKMQGLSPEEMRHIGFKAIRIRWMCCARAWGAARGT